MGIIVNIVQTNKLRTLRRKSKSCVNFSPEIATQRLELDKHCADMQEGDR